MVNLEMVRYCFTNITKHFFPKLIVLQSMGPGDLGSWTSNSTGMGENATSEIREMSETNASPFSLNRPHKHIYIYTSQ